MSTTTHTTTVITPHAFPITTTEYRVASALAQAGVAVTFDLVDAIVSRVIPALDVDDVPGWMESLAEARAEIDGELTEAYSQIARLEDRIDELEGRS